MVTLGWSSIPNASGYNVYRNGVKVGTADQSATFVDSGLALGTTYQYTVSADIFFGGETGQSAPISYTTAPSPCAGDEQWALDFGGRVINSDSVALNGVAIDPSNGDVVVAGMATGHAVNATPVGGTPLAITGDGGADLFVARFDTAHAVKWTKRSTSALGRAKANAVAVDQNGDVLVVGWLQDGSTTPGAGTDFGCGPLNTKGQTVAVVLKLARDTGQCVWHVPIYGAGGSAILNGVAVDSANHPWAIGSFTGTLTLSCPTAANPAATCQQVSLGSQDAFAIELTSSSNYLGAKRFGGAGYDYGAAVATNASGIVALTGYFGSPDATLDGVVHTGSAGSDNGFVAKYDTTGAMRGTPIVYDGTMVPWGIALNPAGELALGGSFSTSASFGGPTLTTDGAWAAFLVKYDAAGRLAWQRQFWPDPNYQDAVKGVALDAAGEVYAVGGIGSLFDFGGCTTWNRFGCGWDVTPADFGGFDPFIVRYGAARGDFRWAKRLVGPSQYDSSNAIVIDELRDRVAVAGNYTGSLSYGASGQSIGTSTALTGGSIDGFLLVTDR
jgi:hypothetical protein